MQKWGSYHQKKQAIGLVWLEIDYLEEVYGGSWTEFGHTEEQAGVSQATFPSLQEGGHPEEQDSQHQQAIQTHKAEKNQGADDAGLIREPSLPLQQPGRGLSVCDPAEQANPLIIFN